jgi:hypothetical protein
MHGRALVPWRAPGVVFFLSLWRTRTDRAWYVGGDGPTMSKQKPLEDELPIEGHAANLRQQEMPSGLLLWTKFAASQSRLGEQKKKKKKKKDGRARHPQQLGPPDKIDYSHITSCAILLQSGGAQLVRNPPPGPHDS